ncbi:MAG TPA: hypothetical protein VNG32_02180, partial [Candidatus Dormibacteraeota bacterium]|nr:hypothetical protein [Candidatus Dormibacteraeota bacterium]
MEPQLPSPENRDASQMLLAGDIRNQTVVESPLSNAAVRTYMRVMALGGIVGSLFAAGAFVAETADADSLASALAPALVASPKQPTGEQPVANASSHTGRAKEKCTVLSDFPGGYFIGTVCSNDLLVRKLGESKPSGYSYGMFYVDNTYKCGWAADGIVKIDHSPRKSAEFCRQHYKSLTFDAHAILKDINCPPGDCTDGEVTKVAPTCQPVAFANFSTAARSVLNVYPNGKSGFVESVGTQTGKIKYRATVAETSQAGLAAVVRQKNLWDFMSQTCVPQPVLVKSHATNT